MSHYCLTLRSIESAYAGGVRGREVIDVLLPNVSVGVDLEFHLVDSKSRGRILLVTGTSQ